jgi:DNA-binding beta-propeller fold protein YncE
MTGHARRALVLAAFSWLLPGPARAADPVPHPLVLERTIPLPSVSGRIDHMAVDLGRGRLFVAELGNGSVEAIDLAAGKPVHRITGLHEPQGVGFVPDADLLAVASAGDGSVRLFRGGDLRPAGKVELNDDADNVRLDPGIRSLVIGYGKGGLAVLDLAAASVLRTAKLPAHPEGFQIDPEAGRAYVNVPDARQVAVVDLATGSPAASWPLPAGVRGNFAMALDGTRTVLAIVTRSPARLIMLDTRTGGVTASLPTCGDADNVFFDAKRHRLYVSCGDGEVDVVQQDGAGYRPLARIPTQSGARTSLFVPELDRLFVAARAGLLGSGAGILVFRPTP